MSESHNFFKGCLIGLLISAIIVISVIVAFSQEPYKITKGKVAGWTTLAIASFVDGAVEGYEFGGRMAFMPERKNWTSNPYSFWGNRSWEKSPSAFEKQFGIVDAYHVGDDIRKVGYVSAGITLGISGCKNNKNWKHWALDIGISLITSSLAKRAGLAWIKS